MKDTKFKKGDGRASKTGKKGGKNTFKRLGTRGMAEIGRKGALKRWGVHNSVAVIASDSIISE